MAIPGQTEAPGALNIRFLRVLTKRPKGPIWPKVTIIGPRRPFREAIQASRDRVPGYLWPYQPYVSVAPVGLAR